MWVSDLPASLNAYKHKCESEKAANYRVLYGPGTFSHRIELNLKLFSRYCFLNYSPPLYVSHVFLEWL